MTGDKEHMLWGKMTYADKEKTRVPRVTYRCRARSGQHRCKKVTDHASPCECICGREFAEKVAA